MAQRPFPVSRTYSDDASGYSNGSPAGDHSGTEVVQHGKPTRNQARPPSFNGEGDLTLFIKQFEDVAEANGWTPKQKTLHIRSQLAGDAQECGHGDSYEEILKDLHARFGVSKRQARDRLAALKLKPGQSIYSQATEVYGRVAY